jgi:hypothetical protein
LTQNVISDKFRRALWFKRQAWTTLELEPCGEDLALWVEAVEYGAPSDAEARHYSPAKCIGADMKTVSGNPDPQNVSTRASTGNGPQTPVFERPIAWNFELITSTICVELRGEVFGQCSV